MVTGDGNYESNVGQSTTKNVTGIYDMSGGAWEYVAGYVNNGYSCLTTYGKSLVNANEKYKDVYSTGSSDNDSSNYTANSSKYGDAVYEISGVGNSSSGSWYSDYSYFPDTSLPFFGRGGYYNGGSSAGLFYFGTYYGDSDSRYSFRPVVVAL